MHCSPSPSPARSAHPAVWWRSKEERGLQGKSYQVWGLPALLLQIYHLIPFSPNKRDQQNTGPTFLDSHEALGEEKCAKD